MKILFLNQYYLPDTAATAQLLGDLAGSLAQAGHEIHIVCSCGGYAGSTSDAPCPPTPNITVHRLSATGFGRNTIGGRASDYLSFYRKAGKQLNQLPSMDLIISLTTPPFIGRLAAGLKRRNNTPWISWSMDCYPEALAELAGWNKRSPQYRLLERTARRLHHSADLTVTLGHCMQEALCTTYSLHPDQCPIIPNWAPGEAFSPEPFPEEPLFMYSGNLGRGHALSDIVDAVETLPPTDRPRIRFSGNGNQRASLRQRAESAGLSTITFEDPVPLHLLGHHLGSASVHIIGQRPGTEGVLVPSKLYGILSAGRPVLFIGPENCEVASAIKESGAGWIVAPHDTVTLSTLFKRLQASPPEILEAGQRARSWHELHTSKEIVLAKWHRLIDTVTAHQTIGRSP